MLGAQRSLAAVLVLATLVAYAPAIAGGWVWDDDQYVTRNQALRSVKGLFTIWTEPRSQPQYYPLVFSSFWLEYRVWGLWPAGYHLTNVLLHAASAVLLARLLAALAVPGAWLAALVFALHPVHVESVAWVTERKNLLSGLFFLLSLSAWARHLGLDGKAPPHGRRVYGLALIAYVAALFGKTVACVLPVAVVLVCWWKRRALGRRELFELAPFFAIGLILGLHTAWLEREHVGASGAAFSLSPVERWLVATRAPWSYLGSLLWPSGLSFIYPRWELDPGSPAQHAFGVTLLVATAALWLGRNRFGRGPLTAALYFGAALFPALGFFNVYPMRFSFVADHFVYLASFGPLALVAGVLATGAARLGVSERALRWAAIALAAVLGSLVWRQASTFRDAETLWRATLARNPEAWLAANNLGGLLLESGRASEALPLLERAVRLERGYAEGLVNLGMASWLLGDLDAAAARFEEALATHPGHTAALYNVASVRAAQGRLAEAATYFAQLVAIDPRDAVAQRDFGRALALQGRWREALAPLESAVRDRPDDETARSALAAVRSELTTGTPEKRE